MGFFHVCIKYRRNPHVVMGLFGDEENVAGSVQYVVKHGGLGKREKEENEKEIT